MNENGEDFFCPENCDSVVSKVMGKYTSWTYCPKHDLVSYEDYHGGWGRELKYLQKMVKWAESARNGNYQNNKEGTR